MLNQLSARGCQPELARIPRAGDPAHIQQPLTGQEADHPARRRFALTEPHRQSALIRGSVLYREQRQEARVGNPLALAQDPISRPVKSSSQLVQVVAQ